MSNKQIKNNHGPREQTSITSVRRSASWNSPSIQMIRFSVYSRLKVWQSLSCESITWYISPRRFTAIQCRGLTLNTLCKTVSFLYRLMRNPTSSRPSFCGAMAKACLRSCHRAQQFLASRAHIRTLTSQSPPKGCLCGLMNEEERFLQKVFMMSRVKTGPPMMLLRLCSPHCSEKRSCFSKQRSYSAIIYYTSKSSIKFPVIISQQKLKLHHTDAHPHRPPALPTKSQCLPLNLSYKKQLGDHICMVCFLRNLCHSSLGMMSTEALSKESERGTSVESSFLWPLFLRLPSVPFLHMRMMRLTSGQPRRQGSLMILEKQFSRPSLRFSMSSGLLLVFCQKCVLGKSGNSVSNFSSVQWTAFSSLKRYLQTQVSLLVRSFRCISYSTTPSSIAQVGIRNRQNLSDRLKSQSPSTSFFRTNISNFLLLHTTKATRYWQAWVAGTTASPNGDGLCCQYKYARVGGGDIINMIGLLSILLFVHAGISTQRWRSFVQVNQEPFFLPIDIALEIALASLLALAAILANTKKFKALKQFTQNTSYDASFFKPNFKNYRTSRAALLLPFLKERLGSEDLALDFKL